MDSLEEEGERLIHLITKCHKLLKDKIFQVWTFKDIFSKQKDNIFKGYDINRNNLSKTEHNQLLLLRSNIINELNSILREVDQHYDYIELFLENVYDREYIDTLEDVLETLYEINWYFFISVQ